MKKIHLQLTLIISGLLLAGLTAGVHLEIIPVYLSAIASILIFPVFALSAGLLLSADVIDGDIPFMGY